MENQCDVDYYNHNYLVEHFPMETATVPDMDTEEANAASVVHGQIFGGEDLDEDDSEEDPETITEKQQREILKIHRNLGHPTPQELGRALRNAGCKRHLVRWAVREMRCTICESRVRPSAKRPAALPRCLRFNQVIGLDLIECTACGFKKRIFLTFYVGAQDFRWLLPYQMRPATP